MSVETLRRRSGSLRFPLCRHESVANPFHDFFETRRLIEDCRLAPVIHCDIDSAAGKTDGSLEVCHPAIQVATVLTSEQSLHCLRVLSAAFFLRIDGDM